MHEKCFKITDPFKFEAEKADREKAEKIENRLWILTAVLPKETCLLAHNISLRKEKKMLCTIGLEWILFYWRESVFLKQV